MLIREEFTGSDVFEFAAFKGANDAASGRQRAMNEEDFKEFPVAFQYCLTYNMAYDLEQLSGLLDETSVHTAEAFVRTWEDCYGQGEVEFVVQGTAVKLYFSYRELTSGETVQPGELVEVTYKYNSKGDRVITTVRQK